MHLPSGLSQQFGRTTAIGQEARNPALSLWMTGILGIGWKVAVLKLSGLVGNGNGVGVLPCCSADTLALGGAGVRKHCFPL